MSRTKEYFDGEIVVEIKAYNSEEHETIGYIDDEPAIWSGSNVFPDSEDMEEFENEEEDADIEICDDGYRFEDHQGYQWRVVEGIWMTDRSVWMTDRGT